MWGLPPTVILDLLMNRTMLRTIGFASLVVIGLLLGSCSPDDPFTPTPKPGDTVVSLKGKSFLRVVHASPDAPDATVSLAGQPLFGNTPQRYLYFQTNTNEAKYYPVDTTGASGKTLAFLSNGTLVAQQTVRLDSGAYYTAYLYGVSGDYRILFTSDTLFPTPAIDSARYRIIHLSPDAGAVDVTVGEKKESATLVLTNLQYGQASSYVRSKAYLLGQGTGLFVLDAGTNNSLFDLPAPFVNLPGTAVFTIVMTGNAKPKGEQPFLFFNLFQENRGPDNNKIYGGLPFRIDFGAVRTINLAATGDSTLTTTFYDPNRLSKYVKNEYYRRDFTVSQDVVYNRPHWELVFDSDGKKAYYFLLSLLFRRDWPYRIEIHQPLQYPDILFNYFPPLVDGPQPLTMEPNNRYTIYVSGPFDTTKARSTVVRDNLPVPSGGNARLRFFHAGFKDSTKALQLRVSGMNTPLQSYAVSPGNTVAASVQVPSGTITAQVLDASGNVLASRNGITLQAGNSYMLAYSNDKDGNGKVISVIPEEVFIR